MKKIFEILVLVIGVMVSILCAKNIDTKSYENTVSITPNNEYKTFTDYGYINVSTGDNPVKDFQNNKCYIDTDGFLKCEGRYCIMLMTEDALVVGDMVDLVLRNGNIINCVISDIYVHYYVPETGSIVSFIVDKEYLNDSTKLMGDISLQKDELAGEIVSVYRAN